MLFVSVVLLLFGRLGRTFKMGALARPPTLCMFLFPCIVLGLSLVPHAKAVWHLWVRVLLFG